MKCNLFQIEGHRYTKKNLNKEKRFSNKELVGDLTRKNPKKKKVLAIKSLNIVFGLSMPL